MSEHVVYSEVKFKNGPSPKDNTTGTGGPQSKETSEDEVVYSSVVISKTPATNQQDPKQLSLPNDPPSAERSKGKCRCPRLLLVVVVLCIMILALGLAVFLALYLTSKSGKPEEETTTKQLGDNRHTTDTPKDATSEGNKEPAVTDPSAECRPDDCETDWIFYNKHCYFFSHEKIEWKKSKETCEKKTSHLTIINDKEEQVFMMKEISTKIGEVPEDKFWIGLNDIANEGIWLWVDGTPLIEKFWLNNEPDNWNGTNENPLPDGEDCVRMGEIGFQESKGPNSWVDTDCNKEMRFICERASCKKTYLNSAVVGKSV